MIGLLIAWGALGGSLATLAGLIIAWVDGGKPSIEQRANTSLDGLSRRSIS